ncbi:hypothetical protein D3C71_2154310 [compost metagenome]
MEFRCAILHSLSRIRQEEIGCFGDLSADNDELRIEFIHERQQNLAEHLAKLSEYGNRLFIVLITC